MRRTLPRRRVIVMLAALWAVGASFAAPAFGQGLFTVHPAGPGTSLKVGVLAQPTIDWPSAGSGADPGVYLRRFRVLTSADLGRIKVFAETDSPMLGVHPGRVVTHEVFVQDLAVTFAASPSLQIDGGRLLVPLAYNTVQSAASLLAVGYGPYSFLASGPTGSKVGRDWGLQARGALAGAVEYRVGVFEGARRRDAGLPYRYAGRVQWYLAGLETGLFHTGTTIGRTRIVTVGAGFDHQADYTATALDVFVDQPLPSGDAITAQADYIHYDGGATLAALPRQDTMLLEAGYYVRPLRTTFFSQFAGDRVAGARPDQGAIRAGAAVWLRGHRLNVKIGLGRVARQRATPSTEVLIQTQWFVF
ncbi:MAG: hypothetical protein AB7O67_22245 [Vicinamibacterales bacterium]